MALRESGEMYLETIYILSKRLPIVRAIDVGQYMGYSKPSVSRALGLLRSKGLIKVDDAGSVRLTECGETKARNIYERHQLLSKLFVALGVDEKTAVEDACRIEHYLSQKTFDAIKRHQEKYGSDLPSDRV